MNCSNTREKLPFLWFFWHKFKQTRKRKKSHYDIKLFRQVINRDQRISLVAIKKNVIIGIADITQALEERDEAVLNNVFVSEENRGLGVGKALIKEAQCWAKERRQILWLRSKPEVLIREVYASCGFIETGEVDEEGMVWMKFEN